MKLLILLLIPIAFFAQVKVVAPLNLGLNLNASTIDVSGVPADFELDQVLWLIRQDNVDRTVKCRRYEIDVAAGTENTTCWVFCPTSYDVAGDFPLYIAPLTESFPDAANGDTIKSFSAHYKPKGVDGCSLFKYEWFDSADPSIVLCSVFIRFSHNVSTSCTASLEEVKSVNLKMYPNPASEVVTLELDKKNVDLNIVDLLGKTVFTQSNVINNSQINVSELKNGVYFISVLKNGIVLKTEKLIVKH